MYKLAKVQCECGQQVEFRDLGICIQCGQWFTEDNMAKKNWIGEATDKMERKGTTGSLHRALNVPEGKKIPEAKMASAKKNRPELAKKIQFAENVRK